MYGITDNLYDSTISAAFPAAGKAEIVRSSAETIAEAISIIRNKQQEERSRRQPEIDRVEAAIRQCEKEKSALLDTLIASGNSLNAEFLSVLNEKTERVSVEMEHLSAKRDILNQELPPEEDF
ncbi:MAG TPA: hypothetical protein DFL85_10735 [Lentisphaeria bacterium]|nr:hypothetical protein C5Q97_14700 [Victivallales bacterium CCUG 44730]HBP08660.1 hypothetical protein [Lentisphaeria bacterium]HCH85977.1 hypothetical protein [Lentisphaeria bacterium]